MVGWRKRKTKGLGSMLRGYVAPPEALPAVVAEGAPAALPGLVMAVAVHEGDRVDFVPPASMDALGGRDVVVRQAMSNLETLEGIDVVREEDLPGRRDTVLFTLSGVDPFVGSRAAVLEWLVEALTGATATPHGLLVAVPSRHRLILHVVSGPGAAKVGATMALVAHHMYTEAGAAATSPWVYFVTADRQAQRVSQGRGGDIVFHATDLFTDALRPFVT